MTLTPEAVRNKQFTPTRFRPGYDEDEVDLFLDEVEAELTRLLGENAELRVQLASAQVSAAAPLAAAPTSTQQPAPAPPQPPPPPREDPGSVALRTLQLAQRTAEEAVAAARAEADSIVGEAQVRANRLEEESRNRVSRLDEESQRQRLTVIADLDRRRSLLEAEVEELRAFEQEYRSRLRAYLESQLRALEGQEDATADGASPAGPDAGEDDADLLSDGSDLEAPTPTEGGGRHRIVRLAPDATPGSPPAETPGPPQVPAAPDAGAAEDDVDIDEGPEPTST